MCKGQVVLPVIITIPQVGLSKFQENKNKSYAELVNLINGKLPQILQTEKNRSNNSKSKKYKPGKYQVIKGTTTKFVCRLEQNKADYCLLENTNPDYSQKDPKAKWVQREVSPLCLQVIAAPLNGYLPFAESGNVLISQFYETDTSKKNTKPKQKKRKSKKKK